MLNTYRVLNNFLEILKIDKYQHGRVTGLEPANCETITYFLNQLYILRYIVVLYIYY